MLAVGASSQAASSGDAGMRGSTGAWAARAAVERVRDVLAELRAVVAHLQAEGARMAPQQHSAMVQRASNIRKRVAVAMGLGRFVMLVVWWCVPVVMSRCAVTWCGGVCVLLVPRGVCGF